jgi:glyoxylase-like metal-dependent hydrolase (beta-lactamase superfamily II)
MEASASMNSSSGFPVAAAKVVGSGIAATPFVSNQNRQAPGFYRGMLGAFEVTTLSDGNAPPRPMDRIFSKPAIAIAEYAANHEAPPISMSINAYLINTGSRLILIDTGAGELLGATSGLLISNLNAAGCRPDQIDTILLTHIHADHSGGLSIGGVRQFPNATVYVDGRDLECFVTGKDHPGQSPALRTVTQQSRATVGPYVDAKKIALIKDGDEVLPGVTARSQPGHTPGHTAYLVESEGHEMFFWGDIVHSSEVQFEHPEVTVQYDISPGEAVEARVREFAFTADRGILVASDHISFPGLGHVRKIGPSYRWVPIPYRATVSELCPS